MVDTIVRNSGVRVRVGGGQSFYLPSSDHIQTPPHETFDSAESYAASMPHELGHAAGAEHRLNGDMTARFGTAAYAAEELRVEIAAAMMCAELGLPCDIQSYAG